MKRPSHIKRHRGPQGTQEKPVGVVIHCTVSNQTDGPSDRNGVIDYLASKGLSVPLVVDDDNATEMVPQPYHGYHAKCLTEAHGIEMIGQAVWTREQWLRHRETIRRAARESAWFIGKVMELPVTLETLRKFAVGHDRDHVLGGCSTHWDPGPDFPWDVFRGEAIKWARREGVRVAARRGDRELIRNYRLPATDRAVAWARKKLKRGWRVVLRKKRFHADFDEWN